MARMQNRLKSNLFTSKCQSRFSASDTDQK